MDDAMIYDTMDGHTDEHTIDEFTNCNAMQDHSL